jgi:hypothetical protein
MSCDYLSVLPHIAPWGLPPGQAVALVVEMKQAWIWKMAEDSDHHGDGWGRSFLPFP